MAIRSALIDSSTNILLAISTRISGIIFLTECTADTRHVPYIHSPNYRKSPFLTSLATADYPKWTWTPKARTLVQTRSDVLTESIKARSRLAVAKLEVYDRIVHNLNIARCKLRTGVYFQDRVYIAKKLQAQKLKESNFNEALIMESAYVMQYADFADLSLEQAADDILLKAKFDDELLLKTELLRLGYFRKLKEANSVDGLPKVYAEFLRDCYINSQV